MLRDCKTCSPFAFVLYKNNPREVRILILSEWAVVQCTKEGNKPTIHRQKYSYGLRGAVLALSAGSWLLHRPAAVQRPDRTAHGFIYALPTYLPTPWASACFGPLLSSHDSVVVRAGSPGAGGTYATETHTSPFMAPCCPWHLGMLHLLVQSVCGCARGARSAANSPGPHVGGRRGIRVCPWHTGREGVGSSVRAGALVLSGAGPPAQMPSRVQGSVCVTV